MSLLFFRFESLVCWCKLGRGWKRVSESGGFTFDMTRTVHLDEFSNRFLRNRFDTKQMIDLLIRFFACLDRGSDRIFQPSFNMTSIANSGRHGSRKCRRRVEEAFGLGGGGRKGAEGDAAGGEVLGRGGGG